MMGILKVWTSFIKNAKSASACESKERTLDDHVRDCCCKFQSIAEAVMTKDKLGPYTPSQWFIPGLSSKLSEEMFFRKGLLFDDDDMEDFDEVVRKALKHVETERRAQVRRIFKDSPIRQQKPGIQLLQIRDKSNRMMQSDKIRDGNTSKGDGLSDLTDSMLLSIKTLLYQELSDPLLCRGLCFTFRSSIKVFITWQSYS